MITLEDYQKAKAEAKEWQEQAEELAMELSRIAEQYHMVFSQMMPAPKPVTLALAIKSELDARQKQRDQWIKDD